MTSLRRRIFIQHDSVVLAISPSWIPVLLAHREAVSPLHDLPGYKKKSAPSYRLNLTITSRYPKRHNRFTMTTDIQHSRYWCGPLSPLTIYIARLTTMITFAPTVPLTTISTGAFSCSPTWTSEEPFYNQYSQGFLMQMWVILTTSLASPKVHKHLKW